MQAQVDPRKELFVWGPIDGAWHYPSYWALTYVDLFPRTYGVYWPEALFAFDHHRMTYICEYEPLRNAGWRVCEKWVLPDVKYRLVRRKFDKAVKRLHQLGEEIVTLARQGGFARNDIAKYYHTWKEAYFDFWNHGTVPELANWGGEKFLMDALQRRGITGQEYLHALEVLSAPSEFGFFQEAERDLLKIARNAGDGSRLRSNKKVRAALEAYAKKYFWLHNSYYGSKVLTVNDFAKMLKDEVRMGKIATRLRAIEAGPRERAQEKEKMIRALRFSPREAAVARKLGQTISWQDERKKYVWQTNHVADTWLREAARRARVQFALCKDLLPDEVEQILRGQNVDVRGLAQARLVSVIRFTKKWKWQVYTGRAARRMVAPFEKRAERGAQEARGLVVSKGPTVRGRVRIIFSPTKEEKRMKKGDILVTGMTSPDYIVVMKRAGAIVMDEGGMTSHAAVVSRELGVPCIVGTKIATQIFKDEDMVEVDTEKGVVRKIE